ncbi:Ig-like domain-containing protein [Moorena producens]|uniref:Ig-like domain-containing protein n=1 Tax=Moorena producens TaxID=1155739 RepID=UPI003C71B8E9
MVKIQAESFENLTNFVTENNDDAEGGSLLRIPFGIGPDASSGTASTTFDLPTGNYEVRLGYFDETDGNSTIDITIGDTELPTLTLDNPPDGAGINPDADSFVNEQISSTVFINNGDLITIDGTRDGQEFARIDFIEFIPLDDNLIAVDDTATTEENTSVTIDVLENDTDLDGNSTLTIVTDASNGTAVVDDNGTAGDFSDDSVIYTPDDGFSGADSFTYELSNGLTTQTATVNIDVAAAVDENSLIAVDDTATTEENTAVTIDVLENDTDLDGNGTVTILNDPSNGTAVVDDNGTAEDLTDDSVIYTPDDGFSGADSFTYELSNGLLTKTATVDIDVTAAVDENSLIAVDDTATTEENTAVTIDVLENDTDLDGNGTVTILNDPSNGTAEVDDNGTAEDSTDDSVIYTPDNGFSGADSFTYELSNGLITKTATVDIDVAAAVDENSLIAVDDTATTEENTAVTIDVLENDTDVDGNGTVTILNDPSNGTAVVDDNGTAEDLTDDSVIYTPDDGFSGADSFTYELSNGLLTKTATVDIDVAAAVDENSLIAVDDTTTTKENTAVTIDVLQNDTDVDGNGTVTILNDPSNGTAEVDDNGTAGDLTDDFVIYTPDDGFSGADSFTYELSNGLITKTATVDIDVAAAVDENSLIAVDDTATTEENAAVTIDVLANDTDINGNSTLTIVNGPSNGTAEVDDNGTAGDFSDDSVIYTPNNGFNGADSLTYELNNGLTTKTATVDINVTPVEDVASSADIFWRNSQIGSNLAWIMNGTELDQSNPIQAESADSPWKMRGAGDFDGDGQKDILWRNTNTGDVSFWLMEGSEFKSTASSSQVSDLNWEIRGTGDFDSDGEEDILWRNTNTGENGVWLMNGTQLDQGVSITRQNNGENLLVAEDGLWQMQGAGDLDNDGDADILWRNTQNQDVYYWRMEGSEYVESVLIASLPISGEWEVRGTMDFDNNGFDDVLLRNGTTGQNEIWRMNETGLQEAVATQSLTGQTWQSYV